MKIVIPNYMTRSRNKTTTKHWRKYLEQRDEMAQLVMAYCTDRTCISPARVIIECYHKGGHAIDTTNIDDKIVVDALMKIGVLIDDNLDENPEVIKRSRHGDDNRLEITVESMELFAC